MQVQAKESLFKELDINKFKTELILLKQQTEKEYSLKNQGIDEEIISVLSSFNSAMYKSIKSDVSVTPITQTKYSVIRSATKKHEYIKHYTSQLRANNDIAEKQAYFRKTAAILNYLKGYDRNISYQIKSSLLSRAKAVVQRGKANDFKGAYYLAEGLSKDFYKYVKLS
jgi:hypothetical protein